MTTELNTLKDLVSTIVRKEEQPETLQTLLTEAERLPDAIKANSLKVSTDKQVQDYIYWQQEILINQANLLYKCCLSAPRRLVQKGLVVILNILKRLNRVFPEHFDNTLQLPTVAFLKKKLHYEPSLQELSLSLQIHGINERLTDITLYPIKWFLYGKMPGRYCDEKFLHKYVNLLLELKLNGLKTAEAETLIYSRLITLNYNGLAFTEYVTGKVKQDLDRAETKKDKEIVLKKFTIRLKSIPVISKSAFDKNFPHIKQALLDWASLEHDALILLPDQGKRRLNTGERVMQKLDISVGILAYLTRLCKVHGIYPGRTHAQVIDHMVETYCTKQTTVISRDSFYNRYKEPTMGVATALRKILKGMVDDIDYFINTGKVRDHTEKLD